MSQLLKEPHTRTTNHTLNNALSMDSTVPHNRLVVWPRRSRVSSTGHHLLSNFIQSTNDIHHSTHRSFANPTNTPHFLDPYSFHPNQLDKKHQEDYVIDENGFRRQVEG
jgi:hypothetical protein